MSLSKQDYALLAQLDTDARQTYLQLGRKLRMNKDTVKYRMERMQKLGIIQGYYTEINTKRLGYTIYRFYVKLQNLNAESKQRLIGWFVQRKETFYISEIVGPWDLAVLVLAKNHEELEQFWNAFKMVFRQYLQQYLLSTFTRLHIFPRKYLSTKPEAHYIEESKETVKIDELDKKILALITPDARLSLVDIALKLNTTAKVIGYRMRRLEKQKIILQYRAKIDYTKLGKGYYKIDMNVNDVSKLKSLHQFAYQHPDIIYINQTLGSTDFEFDVEIESFERLMKLISEIAEKFSVRDYFYFQILKVHKISYFPL
jgi:Lrp/AsnC family leucine-responsive transcriptional regulator